MNYEQKYKEALERASGFKTQECKDVVEYIFPELKESEDEKISREITEFILTHRIDEPNDIEDTNSWLAWLEKQGEKSPFNKERLMEVAKPETFEEQIKHWQRMCGVAEEMVKELLEKQGKQKPTFSERYENIAQSEWFKRTHEGMSVSDDEDNENDRIKKELIDAINGLWANDALPMPFSLKRKDSWISWLEKQSKQKTEWSDEDEKYIDNCCLLIGAADDCYEKTFKDDCIHYLQSLKERIAWKSMPIKQKDIDKLVFNFKWSSENFKNKRVTDIYRQGIYDVMELLKQRM